MNEVLSQSIRYAKECNDWQKIEGQRLILSLEWKIRYQNANKFGKWFMRITTPKSLFEETKFLVNDNL